MSVLVYAETDQGKLKSAFEVASLQESRCRYDGYFVECCYV